ncbi:MAG: VapB-type antitoxin [Nitrososphaerota archaeon]|nr:VapB-type antitoxin [Nitrososphaerota archaeon]
MSTTISVDRRTRDFLARRKKALEDEGGSQLTWDEFFERVLKVPEPPKLTKKEIEELEKIVSEARPWKMRS